jgi:hypothetical protein
MALRQEKPQIGFTRVNIRTARTATQPTDAAKAINVDFNREIGTALMRYGSTLLHTLTDQFVRFITKVNGYRFYVANEALYRDGSNVVIKPSEIDTNDVTDIEGMRPLNDTNIWAFIADEGYRAMLKDNGVLTRKWGIAPPPATFTATTGTNTTGIDLTVDGDVTYYVTYIRFDTDNADNPAAVAHEGNPSTLTLTVFSGAIS